MLSKLRSAIKIHLLHLVGILFPHIMDDARSKPHQIYVGSFVRYFVFCQILMKLEFSRQVSEIHTIKVHENPPSGSRVVP
jgi:hypothetical protein